jgi:hypothetical protein
MKPHNTPEIDKNAVRIERALSQKSTNQRLSCAEAFNIAAELSVSPQLIGQALDRMDHRITHCQLGLFGYLPDKKIVIPEKNVDPGLKAAIEKIAENGRISCTMAWSIADQLQIPKISVSNACEGMGIRIKPCQLGAF